MAINKQDCYVLVTGATGILGSVLIPKLLQEGFNVVALTGSSGKLRSSLLIKHDRLTWFMGDFTRALDDGIKFLNKRADNNFVIHLAGKSDAVWCERNQAETFNINVALVVEILKRCEEGRIRRFIFPSSSLVYGVHKDEPALETDFSRPKLWYGTTKLAAEVLIQGWAAATNLKADVLRISNVYGTQSKPKTVIGRLVGQAKYQQPFQVQDESPMRDFIYDQDVAMGIIKTMLMPSADNYRLMNLSTGVTTQICDVVYLANILSGKKSRTDATKRPDNISSKLILDNTKIKKETGWEPKTSVEEGLKAILKRIAQKNEN